MIVRIKKKRERQPEPGHSNENLLRPDKCISPFPLLLNPFPTSPENEMYEPAYLEPFEAINYRVAVGSPSAQTPADCACDGLGRLENTT